MTPSKRGDNLRLATDPDKFCFACGRPAPTTEGMGSEQLRGRAADWRREAMRLEARANYLENLEVR